MKKWRVCNWRLLSRAISDIVRYLALWQSVRRTVRERGYQSAISINYSLEYGNYVSQTIVGEPNNQIVYLLHRKISGQTLRMGKKYKLWQG